MPKHSYTTRAAALALTVIATGVLLSACGGSSETTATTTTSSASTSAARATTSAVSTATSSAHTAVTSKSSKTAATTVTTAAKTVAASTFSGEPTGPISSKYTHAEVVAIETLAHCVRAHGVPVPTPNFSGKGEVFSTTGINTKSTQYRSALEGCASDIVAILKAAGGAKSALTKIGG